MNSKQVLISYGDPEIRNIQAAPNETPLSYYKKLKAAIFKVIENFMLKFDFFTQIKVQIAQQGFVVFETVGSYGVDKQKQELQIQIFVQAGQTIYATFIAYASNLFEMYKLQELYLLNQSDINQEIERVILTKAVLRYSKMVELIKGKVEEQLEQSKKEVSKSFQREAEATKSVLTHIQINKQFETTYLRTFEEACNLKLNTAGIKLFLNNALRRLKQHIKSVIIYETAFTNSINHKFTLNNDVYNHLDNIFKNHFSGAVKIFNVQNLGGLENLSDLMSMTLLTNFEETNPSKREVYADMLHILCETYFPGDTNIQGQLNMIRYEDGNYQQNREKIDEIYKVYKQRWDHRTYPADNLFAMASLFIGLNECLHKEDMDLSYNAYVRYVLKCIFKNFKDGEFVVTNFHILCRMEKILPDYINTINGQNLSQMSLDEQRSEVKETVKKIRQCAVGTFADHAKHLDQLKAINKRAPELIKVPEKLFFEKLSSFNESSKSIVICISGFLSENELSRKDWAGVFKVFPNTEMIAANWKSHDPLKVASKAWDAAKDSFNKASLIPSTSKWSKLTNVLTATVQGVMSTADTFNETYDVAIATGKYLAHLLATINLFSGYSVSLMGFSLGTLIAVSCVKELKELGRYDIIYDVLLMGGVVEKEDLEKSEILDVVAHRIVNCYSVTDQVLDIALKQARPNANPIGLGPVTRINKKLVNVDVSTIATGHLVYRDVLENLCPRTDFNEELEYLFNKV